jgi:hypothetical protein
MGSLATPESPIMTFLIFVKPLLRIEVLIIVLVLVYILFGKITYLYSPYPMGFTFIAANIVALMAFIGLLLLKPVGYSLDLLWGNIVYPVIRFIFT